MMLRKIVTTQPFYVQSQACLITAQNGTSMYRSRYVLYLFALIKHAHSLTKWLVSVGASNVPKEKTGELLKIFLMTVLIGTAIFFFCNSIFASKTAKQLDKIIAIVNDDVIMASELDQRIFIIKKQMQQANVTIPSDTELKKQVLEDSIYMSLELQIAKRAGFEISNDELNAAIENIAKQNNMSIEEFKNAVEHDGIDYVDYRKQIQNQMLVSRVLKEAIDKKPAISDEEVDKFIKEHNIPNADSDITKKEVMESIYRHKFSEKVKSWLEELKKTAYIKIIAD